MTYRCGIDFPTRHEAPAIICDGCGAQVSPTTRRGLPAMWFLDGKAAPGWAMERTEDETGVHRKDWCPWCKGGRK